MKKDFLKYYNNELRYLRETGLEFAEKHPKIAGRLQLSETECQDPYIERLLEGVAFMAARVHHKLDSEFPRFSQALINTVYPQNSIPAPSFTIASFLPDKDSDLTDGVEIPAKTVLRSKEKYHNNADCKFTTISSVMLYPTVIEKAAYHYDDINTFNLSDISKKAKSYMQIDFKNHNSVNFSALDMDNLPIYITGADKETANTIYEQIFTKALQVVFRNGKTGEILYSTSEVYNVLRHWGFDRDNSLFPSDFRVPNSLRLIREFYAFENKFMYFNLSELKSVISKCKSDELEMIILFSNNNSLLKNINSKNFHLYTAPAANIFEKELDRIYLSNKNADTHIPADRLFNQNYEILEIKKVIGYDKNYTFITEFYPFFNTSIPEGKSFYSCYRKERNLSENEHKYGTRTKYKGSEMYISLIDKNSLPYDHSVSELSITALCSNRDIPVLMSIDFNKIDMFIYNGNYPVKQVEFITKPTTPKPALSEACSDWSIINQFSINYFSMSGEAKENAVEQLKKILSLYSGNEEGIKLKDINNGIADVTVKSIIKRVDKFFPISYSKGIAVEVLFDEDEISSKNMILLASVLNYFFASNIPLNSFVQLTVNSCQRGEIVKWPLKIGIC